MYQMANQNSDQRVRYQANKFIIEMALGKATAGTTDDKNINNNDENKDTNTLKAELEDIKNLKVIKQFAYNSNFVKFGFSEIIKILLL